jgi:long-subunit acyl-CoA synthetase (AMP-forming)
VETGKIIGPNCKGELCFRGPLIMKEYKMNVGETSKAIDSDGWLHSGDLGYYNGDGYFYIVDRLKELIKYQGYQVYKPTVSTPVTKEYVKQYRYTMILVAVLSQEKKKCIDMKIHKVKTPLP